MKNVIRLTENDLKIIVKNVIKEQSFKKTTRGGYDMDRTRSTEDDNYDKLVDKIAVKKQKWDDKSAVISPEPTELQWALYTAQIYISSESGTKNSEGLKEYKLVTTDLGKKRLKMFNKLYSMMDEESKSIMDSSKEINPAFYAYVVKSSESLMDAFERTKRDTRSVIVDNTKTQKSEAKPGGQVEVPKMVFSDSDIPLGNKFATGSPNLKTEYIAQFDSIFTKILEENRKSMIKNNTDSSVTFPGRYLIKDITIVSSSSKVPQSKLPAPYTTNPKDPNDTEGFLRLSEDRAKSMMNMVKKYLDSNSKNIVIAKDFTESINAKGENGDGTSGPDWDRNKGSQHKDYLDAQQAKVIITFAVIPRIKESDDITSQPTISGGDGFIITVSAYKRGKTKIKFIPPTFRFKGGSSKNVGTTLCPIF